MLDGVYGACGLDQRLACCSWSQHSDGWYFDPHSYHDAVSDNDLDSNNGGDRQNRRNALKTWLGAGGLLTGIIIAIVAAIANPLGNNLLADKPVIPGAPTAKLEPGPSLSAIIP